MTAAEPGAIARVYVDLPHHHLDRPFDYLVPESMSDSALPGVRVKVRFAGQLRHGLLLERVTASPHQGRLTPLAKVVSEQVVLPPASARLIRGVADHYAGTFADVARLAIPPRHARVEAEAPKHPATAEATSGVSARTSAWAGYPAAQGYLESLARGESPRAVWTAQPGMSWVEQIGEAVAAGSRSGRGVLVLVPDQDHLDAVETGIRQRSDLSPVVLHSDLGPAERYRRWLRVVRGQERVVVGTRAAVYAPLADLGLVVMWDDGNDLFAEQRAPYPHSREVALLRTHAEGAALLLGGRIRTAESLRLVQRDWARAMEPTRASRRALAPLIRATGDDVEASRDAGARSARIPSLAWRTAHEALPEGPVLVQVPRRGYLPTIRCGGCGGPARCERCSGPLAMQRGGALPTCRWCGEMRRWRCPSCRSTQIRAATVGSSRTVEEIAKAFPTAQVVVAEHGSDTVSVPAAKPTVVVATPGAEPRAPGGYAAGLLLDGWASLALPLVSVQQEALRRWLAAAALVRPAEQGGRVVLVGDSRAVPAQALLRWDPVWAAERELEDRAAAQFPPAARVAEVRGDAEEVDFLLRALDAPGVQVLGPVPLADLDGSAPRSRAMIRASTDSSDVLLAALHAAQGARTKAKRSGSLRVAVDPVDLG